MESYFDYNARLTSWELLDFTEFSDIEVVEQELTEEEVTLFQKILEWTWHSDK